jgi:hypothetical protein
MPKERLLAFEFLHQRRPVLDERRVRQRAQHFDEAVAARAVGARVEVAATERKRYEQR